MPKKIQKKKISKKCTIFPFKDQRDLVLLNLLFQYWFSELFFTKRDTIYRFDLFCLFFPLFVLFDFWWDSCLDHHFQVFLKLILKNKRVNQKKFCCLPFLPLQIKIFLCLRWFFVHTNKFNLAKLFLTKNSDIFSFVNLSRFFFLLFH